MKGLLLKDFYTLTKQLKIFLLIIIIFALVPGYSMSGFAMVYSAMMPISALAYDERSKWDSLAATMPYSARDIVLGKYVLGYIGLACAAVLSVVAQMVTTMVRGGAPLGAEDFQSIILILCVALLMLAINLPFMFKMGVEKGRLVFFGLVAVLVVVGTAVGDDMLESIASGANDLTAVTAIAVAAMVVLNLVSIWLSIRFYKTKAV